MNFEFLLALRFLRSKRKEKFISVVSLFSVIGIAIGVGTLIVVMSVMNGYHIEFLRNIIGIQGHLTIFSYNTDNYIELADEVEKIKDVEFVAPIIIEPGMFITEAATTGGIVRGIDPEKFLLKPSIIEAVSSEAMERFYNKEGVLVGYSLAEQLNLQIGDMIKIVAPHMSSTLLGNIPRMKTFKVVGFFDVGLYQYNSTTVFMPLSDAQLLYNYGNTVKEIEVIVSDPLKLDIVKGELSHIPFIKVVDWKAAQAKWLNALNTERNVMFFILTLIILVAVFNIVSSLIMLVKDKSKSIAILRTQGATKGSIIKIFIIAGSLLGLSGSVVGVILGVSIAKNLNTIRLFLEKHLQLSLFDPVIYFLSNLPCNLRSIDVISIFIIAFGFSVVATIYPAYRAARLMPTEALRYE